MLHTNNQEKQAQHFNWLGNQNSTAIARFQHIYITICRLCTKCQAMDLINNTTKHPSDCFSAEKKLYSGSVTRLCLSYTQTLFLQTQTALTGVQVGQMSHQRCDQKTGSVWSSFSLLCVQEPHVTTQRKSSRAGRQKHRELLKYGSPPGCSGFFLAGHDLFRSVGLCRGERRWYLSALLFTALFCNATGWTCLKPDRRFYSARPAGYLKWIVSFSASVVDILVRLFFELAPSRLQARTWMIQQRIITRTFMSHFTLMCFIVYWKGMKRNNIKTRAQKCANGTEVLDTGQAETTTRHILFPLNQWMQTGSILLPWSQ